MDERTIRIRQKRITRLVKMIRNGWNIMNFDSFVKFKLENNDLCIICKDKMEKDQECIKIRCCEATYHFDCFVQYSINELEERTFIRCSQRCSEIRV